MAKRSEFMTKKKAPPKKKKKKKKKTVYDYRGYSKGDEVYYIGDTIAFPGTRDRWLEAGDNMFVQSLSAGLVVVKSRLTNYIVPVKPMYLERAGMGLYGHKEEYEEGPTDPEDETVVDATGGQFLESENEFAREHGRRVAEVEEDDVGEDRLDYTGPGPLSYAREIPRPGVLLDIIEGPESHEPTWYQRLDGEELSRVFLAFSFFVAGCYIDYKVILSILKVTPDPQAIDYFLFGLMTLMIVGMGTFFAWMSLPSGLDLKVRKAVHSFFSKRPWIPYVLVAVLVWIILWVIK